jgi:nucleolar protein 56
MYILFENISGYYLFFCIEDFSLEFDLSKFETFSHNYYEFFKKIKFKAFVPFKSTEHAIKNLFLLSKGVSSEFLGDFLSTQVKTAPQKFLLGIQDPKLAKQIFQKNKIKTINNEVVTGILRGIRFHFEKFMQNLIRFDSKKTISGISYLFSRSKLNLSLRRSDSMIISSTSLINLLDKDINFFSMTTIQFYSRHFPELSTIVKNPYLFSIVCKYIGTRKKINFKKIKELGYILMDKIQSKTIFEASKTSIGSHISTFDMILVEKLAAKIILMTEFKTNLSFYLQRKLNFIVPNLVTLLGENTTSTLITKAGSLSNLVKYPSSTIQLLGAEKALFRAMKQKTKTPKFGILFNSSFVTNSSTKNKGKICRFLANKCSLAVKIDYFSKSSTNLFGKKLKEQLRAILKFWEEN